jgi:lipopolysaccharide export system protein LptC
MLWGGYLLVVCVVGCKPAPKSAPTPQKNISLSTPKPSISVGVDKPRTEVRDTKTGKIAYEIRNEKVEVKPEQAGKTSTFFQKNVAILYKDGVPVTRLEATHVQADEKSGQVVATGGVVATSLQKTQAKQTLRADTMRWDAEKHLLTGEKNVVFNQEGVLNFPCDRFEADTTIETVTTYSNK